MNQKKDIFQQVFIKYKLDVPVSSEMQNYMHASKKENLKKILKKSGSYSLVFGAILTVFFYLKKAGIGVSITKAAGVLFVTTTIAVTSVSTGTYYTVKYIKKKLLQNKTEEKHTQKQKEKTREKINNQEKVIKKKSPDVVSVNYAYGLTGFSSKTVEKQVLHNVHSALLLDLINRIGKNKVVNLLQKKVNTANIITGTIEKIGNTYIISIKVIDAKTKEVLQLKSGTASKKEDIAALCKKISRQIIQK